MKRLVILLALVGALPVAAPAADDRAIFPTPQSVEDGKSVLGLGKTARIEAEAAPAVGAALASYFKRSRVGISLTLKRSPGFKPEAYRLEITEAGAVVTASDDAGLFYGGITLWQMATAAKGQTLPAVTVNDGPALRWRGAMLDSARHFQSPAFVRSFIDWMAAHKLNRLHWHLVDDQGWRAEIKAFPKLTEVGATRAPATVAGAPALPKIEGYYTQAEMRDIVAYAAARGITIVPEIEMPGHALSAIHAYPEWGMGVAVPPGIESHWGVFPYLYNVEEPTFAALETILGEVISIFPSTEIHIGGDEAVKDQWKASPNVQARIRELGLKDETALQGWFVARIARFLAKHGRRAVGWDELLDGDLPQSAIVMSWRGREGATLAAKRGHDTILSPAPDLYLDHFQSRDPSEPPGRGDTISLASVLDFDTGMPSAERPHLLGVQGNLWSEHIRTDERMAWMAFPRLSALAEIAWTGRPSKDLGGFMTRLQPQLDRLVPFGLKAADSAWRPSISVEPVGLRQARVTVATQTGSPISVSTGGRTRPYEGPFTVSLPARVKAQSLGASSAVDLTATAVRDRDSSQLRTCTDKVTLALEDDFPAKGQRERFMMPILDPCWIYGKASMSDMRQITLDIGQVPFNFQVGRDRDAVKFRTPATADGEFEVRLGGCEGQRIAVLPIAPAVKNPGITRLRASIDPVDGAHDLCITYTAKSVDPLWAIRTIGLSAQ